MDKIINLDIKVFFADQKKKRLIDKYAEITQTFSLSNVTTNRIFQRKFNGFYRVRRNIDWQCVYYDIMERGKTSKPILRVYSESFMKKQAKWKHLLQVNYYIH